MKQEAIPEHDEEARKQPKFTVVEDQEGATEVVLPEAKNYLVALGQHMVECPICGNLEHAQEHEWPGIKICETNKNLPYGKAHPETLNKLRYRVKPIGKK